MARVFAHSHRRFVLTILPGVFERRLRQNPSGQGVTVSKVRRESFGRRSFSGRSSRRVLSARHGHGIFGARGENHHGFLRPRRNPFIENYSIHAASDLMFQSTPKQTRPNHRRFTFVAQPTQLREPEKRRRNVKPKKDWFQFPGTIPRYRAILTISARTRTEDYTKSSTAPPFEL